MSATFQRRQLTDLVQSAVEGVQVIDRSGDEVDQQVGLMSMPQGAGWGTDVPNAVGSMFIPYSVLTPLRVVPAADAGGFGNAQEDWHVPYAIQAFAADPRQVERQADLNRTALNQFLHVTLDLGDASYKVQNVWVGVIDGITRVPNSNPPYFGQIDQITLWLARRRTS